MEQLLRYIVEEAPEDADSKRAFKYVTSLVGFNLLLAHCCYNSLKTKSAYSKMLYS